MNDDKEQKTRFDALKDSIVISIITGVSFGLVFVGVDFVYRGLHEYYDLSPIGYIVLGVIIASVGTVFLVCECMKYLRRLRKAQ